MAHPVVHFEIAGRDGRKLAGFYRSVFEWQIDFDSPIKDYGYVHTAGDSSVQGGIREEKDGPAETIFYVRVPDLAAALDRVTKAGGKVLQPPIEVPGVVTFALFADPEGNRMGMVKG